MNGMARRLDRLEAAATPTPAAAVPTTVIIYDPVTGAALEPVRPGHGRHIWLPDNHRGGMALGEGAHVQ